MLPPTQRPDGKWTPQANAYYRAMSGGTTRKFVLLLLLLTTSGLHLLNTAAQTLLWQSAYEPCVRAFDHAVVPELRGTFAERLLKTDRQYSLEWRFAEPCQDRLGSWSSAIAVAGVATILLMAFAVFWFLPSWRLRRKVPVLPYSHKLPGVTLRRYWEGNGHRPDPWFISLNDEQCKKPVSLYEKLESLRTECQLSVRPRYVIDPGGRSKSAVVFGRPGLLVLCLNNGLMKSLKEEPEIFESVILHEFAHIRNRDVGIAYATVSLWRCWVAMCIIPWVVHWVWVQFTDGFYWAIEYKNIGTALLGLIFTLAGRLVRADVLRNREICADLDALRWGADIQLWKNAADSERQNVRRLHRWWRHLWRFHPHWQKRYDILYEVERGFYENYRWVPSFSQGLLFIFGVFSLGFAVVNDQFPPLWGPAYSIFFYSAVLLPVVTQAAALGEKGGTPLRKKQEAPVQPSNIKQAVVPLLAVLILVVVLSILLPMDRF